MAILAQVGRSGTLDERNEHPHAFGLLWIEQENTVHPGREMFVVDSDRERLDTKKGFRTCLFTTTGDFSSRLQAVHFAMAE